MLRYGAAVVVMAFDEAGQADTCDAQGGNLHARVPHPRRARSAFRREDIIFDPNVFAIATGIEEHNNYAVDFIEATRIISATLPHCHISGRRVERVVLLPRQRAGAPGDPLGVPVSRD